MSELNIFAGHFRFRLPFALALLLLAAAPFHSAHSAEGPSAANAEIAVAAPLSGDEATYGQSTFEGSQLAIEEANVGAGTPAAAGLAFG
jgi:hypothetical protein